MLTGLAGALRWAIPAYRKLVELMDRGEVELVILVDSPTFNLPLARAARKRGIKTFYYIAPQVWAWAEFRVNKIRRRIDRMAVILPFEEDYFRNHGIDAHFVGHPFIHQVKNTVIDPELDRKLKDLPDKRVLIMPGSRRHLVKSLLPAQLRICRTVCRRFDRISLLIAAWPGLEDDICRIVRQEKFEPCLNTIGGHPNQVAVFTDRHAALIANADLTLAASGTGTLQIGWYGRPMIVMYHGSRWLYHLLGRWLISTKYLSLINILAGRELVPEFMPYIKDETEIAETALGMLADPERSARLGEELKSMLAQLDSDRNPAERAAELVCELFSV